MQIPTVITSMLEVFIAHGFDAYIVGGAVRDAILSIPTSDYDIATNAKPEEVIQLFPTISFSNIGIKHGTVGCVIETIHIEITTFRQEHEYVHHRKPSNVSYLDSIEEDVKRRDFTINALAYKNGEILDVVEGLNDLHHRMIRAVGIPDTRFQEDALRMLRALRLKATHGFQIETSTYESIVKNALLLKHVSAERITSEWRKLILGAFVSTVIKEDYFIFTLFFNLTDAFGENDVDFTSTIAMLLNNTKKTFILRHAAFLFCHYTNMAIQIDANVEAKIIIVEKQSEELFAKKILLWKFTKKETQEIKMLYHLWTTLDTLTDVELKLKMNDIGVELLLDICQLKCVYLEAKGYNDSYYRRIYHKIIEFRNGFYLFKKMQISGTDLLELGAKEGPLIQNTLKTIYLEILNNRIVNEKSVLILLAKSLLNIP